MLFAFRLSKAGYVVAAPEASVVIGRLWFAERRLAARLAGAALVLAASSASRWPAEDWRARKRAGMLI